MVKEKVNVSLLVLHDVVLLPMPYGRQTVIRVPAIIPDSNRELIRLELSSVILTCDRKMELWRE